MPPGPMGAGPGARFPVDYAAEEGLDSPIWAGIKGAAAGVGAALPLIGRVSRRFAPPPVDTSPAPDAAGTIGTLGAQVLPGFTRGIPEMILAGRAGGLKGVTGAAAAGQADDLAYQEMLKRLQTGEEGNYLEDLATGSGIAASGPDDTAGRRIMRGLTIPAAGGFAGIGGKLAGSAGLPLNLGFDVLSGLGETALNIGGQGGEIDPQSLALSGGIAGLASLLGGRPRIPVDARVADVSPPPEVPIIPDAGPRSEPPLPIIQGSPISPSPVPRPAGQNAPTQAIQPLPAILEGLEPPKPSRAWEPGIEGANAPTGQFEAKMAAQKGRDVAELNRLTGKKKAPDARAEADREYDIDKRVEYENAKRANPEFFQATEAAGMDPQSALDLLAKTPGNIKTARAKADAAMNPPSPAGAKPLPETAQVTPPPVQPTDVGAPAGKSVPRHTPGTLGTAEPVSDPYKLAPTTEIPAPPKPLAETLMGGVRQGMKEAEPLPTAKPSGSGLPNNSPEINLGGMGSAMSENMYARIHEDLKAGKPMGKSGLEEQVMEQLFKRGHAKTPEELKSIGQAVSGFKGSFAERARQASDFIRDYPAPQAPTPPAAKETAPVAAAEAPIQGTAAKKASIFQDRQGLGLESVPSPARQAWQGELEKAIDEGLPEKSLDLAHDILAKPRSLTVKETAGMTAARVDVKTRFSEADAKFKAAKDPAERMLAQADKDRLKDEYDALSRAMLASGTEKGRQLAAQRMTLDDDLDLLPSVLRAEMNAGKPLDPQAKGRVESSSRRVMAARDKFEKAIARQSERSAIDTLPTVKRTPEEVKALGDKLRSLLRNGCLVK